MLLSAFYICCFLLYLAWILRTTLSEFRSCLDRVDLLVFSLYIVSLDKYSYIEPEANQYKCLVGLVWCCWGFVLAWVHCIVDLTVGVCVSLSLQYFSRLSLPPGPSSSIVLALSTQALVLASPTLLQPNLVASTTALALYTHHEFRKYYDIIFESFLLQSASTMTKNIMQIIWVQN